MQIVIMDVATLAHQARGGDATEALADLVALATDGTGGEKDWQAAAAAIEILFWQERWVDAADLAEAVIGSGAGSGLAAQTDPFDMALVAAELYAAVPAGPRLRRLAGLLPAGSALGEQLAFVADQLPVLGPAPLLPCFSDWGGAPQPLGPVGDRLAGLPYRELVVDERRALWSAVGAANDIGAARRILAVAPDDPEQFASRLWLAGWAVHDGSLDEAERLLIAAADVWWPFEDWDCLPAVPVLQPVLRRAVTEAVRRRYLAAPLGPEAHPVP